MIYDFETNILIIGGGPAGATLARKLSKNGIKNTLIEKNENYDKPCGGGIKSIVFEEFDIPKELESKRIVDFELFSPNKKVSVNLSKTPISIVLRQKFDKKNRELARDAGTILQFGRFISFEKINNEFITSIKIEGKILKIKSKYLVAADGVTSSVRKFLKKSYPEAILTSYVNIPNKSIDKCQFYFGEKFASKEYAWVFPHGDKLSVGTVLNKNSNTKELFKDFKERIIPNDDTKIKGFYIPTWEDDSLFYEDGVFFVGDSASQVLPFTYEGIYYVMQSASILADAIISQNPQNYEKWWNEKYKKRFKFFKSMQRIFLSSTFMTNKMISFFQNEKIQKKGLQLWEGTAQPLSLGQAVLKIFKYLFKN